MSRPGDVGALHRQEVLRQRVRLDRAALQALRGQATTDLLSALRGRNDSESAWSWFDADQTAGLTWRMQTHEATVHRVDADPAAGPSGQADHAEVAEDGVDHV